MSLPGQPTELLERKEPWAWINKEKWDIYIKGDTHDRRAPSDVSIFRVPIILKEQKKEAYYVPKIVSLGPYHRTSENMARHKGRALRRMMARNNPEFSDRAKEEIANLYNKIRVSYEEHICCDRDTLAMMLTLDGCFILEILRTRTGDELEEASKYYDPIFGREKINYTGMDILHDILKLENQIPLMVLQHLLQLDLKLKAYNFLAFLERALFCFNPFRYDRTEWHNRQPHETVHLLDLLHGLIVSPLCHHDDEDQVCCTMQLKHTQKTVNDFTRSHRATELRNAGINFRACSGGIKQIKFESKSATICLPPITIEDNTEVLFRNLIAFEMCKPSETNYVTLYVTLMNDLIDSNEDVALLRRMGIVTNYLGSDTEAAELFNGLGRGANMSESFFLDQLGQQVNAHYHSRTKIQIAKLVDEHFSSPWKFLGLAGAIILLLLAILQTVYTIISVYK